MRGIYHYYGLPQLIFSRRIRRAEEYPTREGLINALKLDNWESGTSAITLTQNDHAGVEK
jgi:hypothetical protein